MEELEMSLREEKNVEEGFSLEENFARLESTIEKLEADDISLEEAFRAYSTGMDLLKQCSVLLDRVEKKVMKLSEQGILEEL